MTPSFTRTVAATFLLTAFAGCAMMQRDPLEPTRVDKAVMTLLGSKRDSKKIRAALKTIARYAEPPAKIVETFRDDAGVTHNETEMMYPELGIKVFFYDGVFSGADSIPDYEKLPGE